MLLSHEQHKQPLLGAAHNQSVPAHVIEFCLARGKQAGVEWAADA